MHELLFHPLTGTGPRVAFLVTLAVGLTLLAAMPLRARCDAGDAVRVPAGRWWSRAAGPILAGTAVVAGGAWFAMEVAWRPLADRIDSAIYIAAGGLIAGACLATARWLLGRRRALAWIAPMVAIVTIASLGLVNVVYHLYPNLDSFAPEAAPRRIALDDVPRVPVDGRPGPVADWWEPPKGMPRLGALVALPLKGEKSGFRARDAQVYLPPAYFTSPRPRLPVIVVMHGVPGAPGQWFETGMAGSALNRWAGAHRGLAPIVVAVDDNGSTWHDTLCVDSPQGNARTYITTDVPAQVKTHFDVDTDPDAWAIAGLSRGGTCSVQTALAAPHVYSTFLDMSGELHPIGDDRAQTIREYYHGDAAAYDADDPAVRLAREAQEPTGRWEGMDGRFIAGNEDPQSVADLTELHRLCRAAGIPADLRILPGGHTWEVWGPGFAGSLTWFGVRLGLARGR